MATYCKIVEGTFIERPNRFIAMVEINGNIEKCHVKNTGRCKELLIKGVKVYLSVSDNPSRSTAYDLIAVVKNDILINMDSQIPNVVVAESLTKIPFFKDIKSIKREFTFGNSRIDILAESNDKKYLIEVKGVTLENDGIAMFPDAPTERGTKHLNELAHALNSDYVPCIFFLIQMTGVKHFQPNYKTDPKFSETLKNVHEKGVKIFVYDSIVTPNSIELGNEISLML